MDVKAIYVKAEGNRLYFCVEYYGEMPNSPLYDRAIRVYMDTDRNIQTGGPGYNGYGAGWDCYIRFGLYGDGSTSDAYLERWNSTTGSWWRIEDVTLGVTSASSLSYMEIWIDQQDIGYTPDGIYFYMDICSRLEAMPPAELSYIVGSSVKHITVDGEKDDWGTVTPLHAFEPRSITPPELEVSNIYVANDEENLYVRMDMRGTPSTTISDGILERSLYAYFDTDNNDHTGHTGYSGAEFQTVSPFNADPEKNTYVNYYKYVRTGESQSWQLVAGPSASSDINEVFEFKIPLSYLGLTGNQLNLYLTRKLWDLKRLTPKLAYPPMVIPDTTPPVAAIRVGKPSHQSDEALYVSGLTGFTLSANDDTSGVKEIKYRVNEGSWNTYTTVFTLSSYSDGQHTIVYYSSDKADNNESEKTKTITLDKTPPMISNASPTGSMTLLYAPASVTFTVRVEDSGSGVKEVKLIIDGVSQGTMSRDDDTYTKTVSLSEEPHTWSVEAVDNVGNAATQSNTFTVSSLPIWSLTIVVIVIVAILLAVLLLRRRRLPPPPPPPA